MSVNVESVRSHRDDLTEVYLVQNPALGAFLLWRMGAAYQQRAGNSPRIDLYFIVLSMLFHRPTLDVITKTLTGSGLSQFVSKMHEREDDLMAIHTRSLKLRDVTLQSLTLGVAAGLLAIDYVDATVRSLDVVKLPSLPERLKPMSRSAEKVGHWFGDLPAPQVFSMLRVVS